MLTTPLLDGEAIGACFHQGPSYPTLLHELTAPQLNSLNPMALAFSSPSKISSTIEEKNKMPRPLLELKSATKSIVNTSSNATRTLFRNLSLSIDEGDRVGIFSSENIESLMLINCLAGVVPLDKGSLIQNGSISWPLGANETLDAKLSGYANAQFATELYGKPGYGDEELELILKLSGVSRDQYHQPFGTYKSLEKDNFKLALSLAFDFDCYLIGRIGCWRQKTKDQKSPIVLKYMREKLEGKTLVVSSANQAVFAFRYCKTGIAIIEGSIVYSGDPEVCLEIVREHRQILTEKQQNASDEESDEDIANN